MVPKMRSPASPRPGTHVRVGALHGLHTLRRADDAHELDVLYADFLEEGCRRRSAAAGGQHGIDDDNVALRDIGGHLEIVLHRLQRLGVAEQADVAYLDVRHHGDHAVHHAETGPEDRHDGELLACDAAAFCHGHGGLDVHLFER